jgi:hypothetical protein
MTDFETAQLKLLVRLVRSVETIAASQRFLAEQMGRRKLDDEIQAERGRNEKGQ